MANIVICADIHLRTEKPRCRLDEDWMKTQKEMLKFIAQKSIEYKAPIIIAGDIFHKAKSEPILVSLFLQTMQKAEAVYIMPGQHDLPNHQFESVENSSFGNLWFDTYEHPWLHRIKDFGDWVIFGTTEIQKSKMTGGFLFLHIGVSPEDKELPFGTDTPKFIVDKYPGYKFIVAGDYHHGHISKVENTTVIVPGCTIRQAADMKEYKPFLVLYDEKKEKLTKIYIPDVEEMVTDEYLKEEEKKEDAIGTFVEALKTKTNINLSFDDNIKKNLKEQTKEIQTIVTNWMDTANGK